MAEEEGFEERTEEASPRKREELKKEGRVAQSKELTSAILMLSVAGTLYGSAGWVFKGFVQLFEASYAELTRIALGDFNIQTISKVAYFCFKNFIWIMAPVGVMSIVVAILGNVVQAGVVWTTKPLEPDLDKLNPINGFMRLISMDGLFDLFKAILKFTAVGFLMYGISKKWVFEAGNVWDLETGGLLKYLGQNLVKILFSIGGAMAVLAAGDFAFQKFRFEKKIMMTKQEVREERKQMDGNPQVRARIRSLQRKFATNKMLDAVKKADVVVTNPTHFAVALVYDRESMFAPRVVAKGADHMAQKIKQIARENGVPCVENVPLARALYKALKIGQFISKDLYNAVAEVLAYVYRLRGKKL